MSNLAKLRRWINRDDGRVYQAGNRPLSGLEATGLLIAVGAIPLWQLHVKSGISDLWAFGVGAVGLVLVTLAGARRKRDPKT